MNNILQICHGHSAAGSLRQAGYNFILIFTHEFYGPIQDFQKYEVYEKTSELFLNKLIENEHDIYNHFSSMFFLIDQNKDSPFYSKNKFPVPLQSKNIINILRHQEEIHFWLTASFSEHILLALIIKLFDLYEIDFHKLRIKWIPVGQDINGEEFEILGLGWVTPKKMKTPQKSLPLTRQQVDYFRKIWLAITSPFPTEWIKLAQDTNQFNFIEGLKQYLNRLPHSKNGLNYCQRELLKIFSISKESNVARAIGNIIGESKYDCLSESYVYWWLKSLSQDQAQTPACFIKTVTSQNKNLSIIAQQYVTLTDYGYSLREGNANWLKDNQVDYFVGGLHISSLDSNFYFSDKILSFI